MPSARIHEVIAKKINKDYGMDEMLLRIGSVAPDCWRNVNESGFKDKFLTHFWDFRVKEGQANDYTEFYLKYYDKLNNPFYFGYLLHLMTDQYWKTVIDPKYTFIENDMKMCKLRDGSIVENKDYFSYYESLKLQKQLCKKYDLGLFPIEIEDIPNFECSIDEVNLSGLFGPNGTLNYINTEIVPTEPLEYSTLYGIDDIEKNLNKTTRFIKSELYRLKGFKKIEDNRKKIAIDIDDTLLDTKELKDYYWELFIKNNPEVDPNLEYKWGDPILAKFWAEYRELMAFGKLKAGALDAINELIAEGYRIDFLSARPLDKYASLKKKLVEYFEAIGINYDYINLGFYSKKEFLKEHGYDILIDNDMRHVNGALEVGVTPILYGEDNNFDGLQTNNWNDIPSMVEKILNKGKVKFK